MYSVPFDKGVLTFDLPPLWRGTVLSSHAEAPLPDPAAAVRQALAAPVGSPPLRALASPRTRACIVFTDATRACPEAVLVPAILEELRAAGVPPEYVTLLCGTGMHRPSTPQEKAAKLGEEVARRYRVIDNEPGNPAAMRDLGRSEAGVPLVVHRAACEADLLIATGIVEPHQYAGYSGGGKTVAIGAGGTATIEATHSPAMVEHPRTRLGVIADNPFRAAVHESARRAGLRFIVNVIQDDSGREVHVRAGAPEAAFDELVGLARRLYEAPVAGRFDAAVAGVGYPKDVNLYQATRAASYLFFAPVCPVVPGGAIIVPAACGEGAGMGAGERAFKHIMRDAPSVAAILADAREHGYPAGGQRAFIMAKVMLEHDVIIVGARDPGVVRDAKLDSARTMEEAFALVAGRLGRPGNVLVVPHALLTLPIVRDARD